MTELDMVALVLTRMKSFSIERYIKCNERYATVEELTSSEEFKNDKQFSAWALDLTSEKLFAIIEYFYQHMVFCAIKVGDEIIGYSF